MKARSVRELVGHTPIVRLDRLGDGRALYGKCEFMNPGGSIKDRIGFAMVEQAERRGELRPGGTIVEATAGNTGVALAMAAAQKGYRMVAVMTSKASREKLALLRAFGAEVVVVSYGADPDDPDAFINYARRIAASIPDAWYADQFANPDNTWAHFEGTGPELWEQTEGELDAFVCGAGTGGTLTGVGRLLRSRQPGIRIVLADPHGSIFGDLHGGRPVHARPYLVEGIGGDFVPGNVELALVDEVITVSDADAIRAALQMLRREGLLVGASSGCILAAALRYLDRPENRGQRVLAVLPDGGRSYLSTIYDEAWRASQGIALEPEGGSRPCTC